MASEGRFFGPRAVNVAVRARGGGSSRVQLDLTAAKVMNDTGAIEVTFGLAPELLAALRATLRQSFAGRADYVESA